MFCKLEINISVEDIALFKSHNVVIGCAIENSKNLENCVSYFKNLNSVFVSDVDLHHKHVSQLLLDEEKDKKNSLLKLAEIEQNSKLVEERTENVKKYSKQKFLDWIQNDLITKENPHSKNCLKK